MLFLRKFLFTFLLFSVVFSGALAQTPTPQQSPVAVTIDPKIFDAYTGQYEDQVNLAGSVFSFFREGEKFYVRVTNQDKTEILPVSDSRFFVKRSGSQIEFVRNAAGKATGMIFRQTVQEFTTKRISDKPQPDTRIPYKRSEAMITMRDGVKLYTVMLTPEKPKEPAAILMDRTPYGVKGTTANSASSSPELAKEGYVFVFQDIRGRFDSEGQFIMNRPPRDKRDPKSVDESTDTYDTIDWLIKNVPNNNGRVGIYGVSYDGWLSAVALMDPHPALRASSPQAPMTDAWMGDDFFHNGAFRMSYGYEYAKWMEYGKPDADPVSFDIDSYDWYMKTGVLSKLAATLDGRSPTFTAFMEHPAYDDHWRARSSERYLPCTNVPTLVVGGWWDQEDEYGALATYRSLEKCDKNNNVFFVMGPWNHGGWGGRGRRLGAVDFGVDTGNYFKQEIQAPFFACRLKGKCPKKTPGASIFQSGSNKWMAYDAWPPKLTQTRKLYVRAGGKLSFDKPADEKGDFDSYVSDPADPVPYRKRPIEATYDPKGSGWYTWLVSDQRFLADRKDVLKWQTDVLPADVTITGDIVAHLFASTTGTDIDWVVKLIDVYPDEYLPDPKMAGYQLMVADEILRGRYRSSFEKPEAITANNVLEYTIDLRGNDHVFQKGHRIMVQVQSTWFPLYDRNPQTFVKSIFDATANDFKPATQQIYRTAKYPSHLSVSVK
jgi:uncharacterized protein